MKKSFVLLFIVLCIFLFSGKSYADVIVDTGIPTTSPGIAVSGGGNYPIQWQAAEFSIPTPGYSITDIEGWILPSAWNMGLFVDIREGGVDQWGEAIPSDTILYSSNFTITAWSNAGWYGVHGMQNWELSPGNYWVVFATLEANKYVNMPKFPLNPLGNEAWYSNGTWYEDDGLSIGVRISGNPLSTQLVPEPATLLLLGLGLMGLAGLRRKLK